MSVWLHYIGQKTPIVIRSIDLLAVHGTSASNVWVAGSDTSLARRWDGSAWIVDDFSGFQLDTVFADSGTGAWVSPGGGAISHWTGSWATETPDAGYFAGPASTPTIFLNQNTDLTKLGWYAYSGGWGAHQEAAPSNFVYTFLELAIGTGRAHAATQAPNGTFYVAGDGTSSGHFIGTILRISGGTVTDVFHFIDAGAAPAAVWAADNTHIYMIFQGHLYLWDSTGPPYIWNAATEPAVGFSEHVHGVGPTDFWVNAGHSMYHWTGAAYTAYALPTPPASAWTWQVNDVWAVGSSDVWAVGQAQNTSTGPSSGIVWHWAGSSWSIHTVFTS